MLLCDEPMGVCLCWAAWTGGQWAGVAPREQAVEGKACISSAELQNSFTHLISDCEEHDKVFFTGTFPEVTITLTPVPTDHLPEFTMAAHICQASAIREGILWGSAFMVCICAPSQPTACTVQAYFQLCVVSTLCAFFCCWLVVIRKHLNQYSNWMTAF